MVHDQVVMTKSSMEEYQRQKASAEKRRKRSSREAAEKGYAAQKEVEQKQREVAEMAAR